MQVIKNIYILIFLTGFLLSESGYNTIYLMEFENLHNDFTNSHLTDALPDLIKTNYKFREDIKVEYSGDIRPYLKQIPGNEKDMIKGLIINGDFQTINNEFLVRFEAYDIQNWKRLVKRQVLCPVQDMICVHDGFLKAIELAISPFLTNALNIDATIASLELDDEKQLGGGNDLSTLSDLEKIGSIPMPNDTIQKQGQYGDRYYREFDINHLSSDPNKFRNNNSQQLISILDQILTNPYDVLIGELSIFPDPNSEGIVNGKIPITYSIRSALTQELFTSLPHEKIMDNSGNVILQFPNEKFIFDDLLLEKLALMKFQLVPVIFFNNKIGGVQFIILDSWNEKYKDFKLNKISMLSRNQFKPLFALTPGANNIQLDLDVSSHKVLYEFSIPYEMIGDYTKVTVKFLEAVELDALLDSQLRY
jgi:hypothetical protein